MNDTWVCEYCSHPNDDDAVQCLVCDGERPLASLSASMARKAKERKNRRLDGIYTWWFGITQGLFIGATVLCALITLIMLGMKLESGSLGGVMDRMLDMVYYAGENAVSTVSENAESIGGAMSDSTLLDVSDNWRSIAKMEYKTSSTDHKRLFSYVKKRLDRSFDFFFDVLSFCGRRAEIHGAAVEQLWKHVADTVGEKLSRS